MAVPDSAAALARRFRHALAETAGQAPRRERPLQASRCGAGLPASRRAWAGLGVKPIRISRQVQEVLACSLPRVIRPRAGITEGVEPLIVADQLLDLGAARPPPFALRVIDCSAFDAPRRSLAAKVRPRSELVEQANGEAGVLIPPAHCGPGYLAGWLGASRIHDPTGGGGTSKGGLAGPAFSCFGEHATPKQRMASTTARYFISKAFGPD